MKRDSNLVVDVMFFQELISIREQHKKRKDKHFDFAVSVVHDWHPLLQIWTCLTITTRQHMTGKPKLLSFILFLMYFILFLEVNLEKIYPNSLK